jgi:hypothetical protein
MRPDLSTVVLDGLSMSPEIIGISTTYKTRVALEKPCKKR